MKDKKSIYVTHPFLPPLEEFRPYLEKIWESGWLTNNGPYHNKFEKSLCQQLCVDYLSVFTNGTLALIVALQGLKITGEVITTPYSFVATTHSLHWNGIEPVFVDIEPETFNMDHEKIEAAITPRTTAILPVHVYGIPCEVDKIQNIADKYGLKVIYDAAHAFGVEVNGRPVIEHGDLSILSFHATKIFNTFEGGAIICKDERMKKHIDYLKNFGFADEVTVVGPGINAKMNEFQAALGLLQLEYINDVISEHKQIDKYYRESLAGIPGLKVYDVKDNVTYNYSYFPLLVEDEFPVTRDELYNCFREKNIYTRRYFYPLISEFPTYRGLPSASSENLPVANSLARKVLCLPIYAGLSRKEQNSVLDVIYEISRKI